jgi:hypothetical protein
MKYLIILILTLCIFEGCSPAYVPNIINAPLLKTKGEFNAVASTGISGFDFQTAYAVTEDIGLMLNGNLLDRTRLIDNYKFSQQFVEAGAGFFHSGTKHLQSEIYLGAGVGNAKGIIDWQTNQINQRVQMMRLFVQPSLGFTSDYFDFSFSLRTHYLFLESYNERANGLYFEPALTSKIGWKYVKVITQFGLSIAANQGNTIVHQPFIANIGLQLNLGRKRDVGY